MVGSINWKYSIVFLCENLYDLCAYPEESGQVVVQAKNLTKVIFPAFTPHILPVDLFRNLCNKIQTIMATTTFHQSIATNYKEKVSRTSAFKTFINWCKGQEENRLIWLSISLAGHGCMLTPLTILAVLLAGNSLVLFMLAVSAMAATLICNLAAMPTKITIPVLIFSILTDLGIIIACALIGFDGSVVF
jgi:hypothetical protein